MGMKMPKRDGRFTRPAPAGGWRYVARNKVAKYWRDMTMEIGMHGNNVNSAHVYSGWHLCYNPTDTTRLTDTFEDTASNFQSYMDRELGTYVVFMVRKKLVYFEDITT